MGEPTLSDNLRVHLTPAPNSLHSGGDPVVATRRKATLKLSRPREPEVSETRPEIAIQLIGSSREI